jgi:threonine dehydrogenase-like Zn-dependent dehydrogenase
MTTVGQRIRCRAAVAYAPHKPVVVEDIYVDPPQTNEVRVKIIGSGICRSDLHIIESNISDDYMFPLIMGHEGSGIVESVGQLAAFHTVCEPFVRFWRTRSQPFAPYLNIFASIRIRTHSDQALREVVLETTFRKISFQTGLALMLFSSKAGVLKHFPFVEHLES